jgi:hypothetical protein
VAWQADTLAGHVGLSEVAAACGRGLHPVLDVIDRNRAAVALYERLGWRIAGSLDVELAGRPERLVCYVARR